MQHHKIPDLERIVNSSDNLCYIDNSFNSYKNVGLELQTQDDPDNLVVQLRAYLWAYYHHPTVEAMVNATHAALTQEFARTRNLGFWAVSRILRDDREDFEEECRKAQNVNPEAWQHGLSNAAAGLLWNEVPDEEEGDVSAPQLEKQKTSTVKLTNAQIVQSSDADEEREDLIDESLIDPGLLQLTRR
jgi:hypothetical protein